MNASPATAPFPVTNFKPKLKSAPAESLEFSSGNPVWQLIGKMFFGGMPRPIQPNRRSEMRKLMEKMTQLWKDEEGATAVEYGLLVAAIAAVIVVTVYTLGGHVNDAFTSVNTEMAAH
jgi:pilus assembly protein Flp/PilA